MNIKDVLINLSTTDKTSIIKAINEVKTDFAGHSAKKDNPHSVTKTQVGLGSVENYGIATQAEAAAGTATNKYMTPIRTKQAMDAQNAYGVATGTNTLVVANANVPSYQTGMLVAFKNTTANTGATTLNINGLGAKTLLKSNGTAVTSGYLKAGGMYQVRYDGTNFYLLGEGGEYGTAIAGDVLSGKTIGTDNGIITGTMVNRGAVSQAINAGGSYTIPAGYHNGSGKVTGNTLASQTSADATAAQILSGKTAWVNGSKITGTISSKPAATITPGTANQTIAANQFLSGAQTIAGSANLIAANIISGKNIFGINGTATSASLGGLRVAKGSVTISGERLVLSNLAFTPKVVIAKDIDATSERAGIFIFADKTVFTSAPKSVAATKTTGSTASTYTYTVSSNGFTTGEFIYNGTYSWIAMG